MPDTTEEYVVAIAASLGQYFIRRNRSVGLLAYGQSREIIQPDRGERQTNRILETLAVLRAKGQVPIENALQAEIQLFPRGTTLIVVTPTYSDKWAAVARQLSQRGLRVVSVLVNPASFGGSHSSATLAKLLQGNGIITYLVNCGDNLTVTLSTSPSRSNSYSFV